MAIYQFRLMLIPCDGIRDNEGNIPSRISEQEIILKNPWQNIYPDLSFLETIASETSSWSEEIRIWGNEHSDCIKVIYENNCIIEIDISIDLRKRNTDFTSSIIALAKKYNCCLYIDRCILIEPEIKNLVDAIYHSIAFQFTLDPVKAIPLYSQNKKNKALGCLYGGAIGDAIAGPYEGQTAPVIYDEQTAWRLSDDTQFTLATCEAIIQERKVNPAVIADYFLKWFRKGRFTGMGASTLKAMQDLAAGAHWALSGRSGEHAAGNGAAMRIAPVAMIFDEYPMLIEEESRRIMRQVCYITHKNDEAYIGALALSYAISLAIDESWIPGMPLLSRIAKLLPDTCIKDRLLAFGTLDSTVDFKSIAKKYGCGGYVVESVPIALLAVERFLAQGFEKVIMECIKIGGDTDTIASMASQISGAHLGKSALPQKWVERLPEKKLIYSIFDQFTDIYTRM